jgi:hypothetical protein
VLDPVAVLDAGFVGVLGVERDLVVGDLLGEVGGPAEGVAGLPDRLVADGCNEVGVFAVWLDLGGQEGERVGVGPVLVTRDEVRLAIRCVELVGVGALGANELAKSPSRRSPRR